MVILGLGANLGDRVIILRKALREIRRLSTGTLRISPVYESPALLPQNAPADWDRPYFNIAVAFETSLSPEKLLAEIKNLEARLGRKERERWAPREIDIDILAWDALIYKTPALQIPHAGLLDRAFALLPLADIAPEWRYPEEGPYFTKSARELALRWGSQARVVPTNPLLTEVVGILNITPDSFSDGGKFTQAQECLKQARKLIDGGAAVLDVGAESTRPSAQSISAQEEWQRLKEIFPLVRKEFPGVILSIDTRHASTALEALKYGANWINDVTGLDSHEMRALARESGAEIVCMHHLGVPPNSQRVLPADEDPVEKILAWATKRITELTQSGIPLSKIIFDPGIGFGKTVDQNLRLIRDVGRFRDLGVRLLVGHSRKSFLSLFNNLSALERDLETQTLSTYLASWGVDFVRVHDAESNLRAMRAGLTLQGYQL